MSNNILQSPFTRACAPTLDHPCPQSPSTECSLKSQLWHLAHSLCSAGPADGIVLLSRESVKILLPTPCWALFYLGDRNRTKNWSGSKKYLFPFLDALHKYFHIYVLVQIKGCYPHDAGLISTNTKKTEWNLGINESLNSKVFQGIGMWRWSHFSLCA